jgi:O-antigen ligase
VAKGTLRIRWAPSVTWTRAIGCRITQWPSAIRRADTHSALLGFALVAALGFRHGGYDESVWGWAILSFAALTALVLLLRGEVVLGPLEWISLGSLGTFTAFVLLSHIWGITGTEAGAEAERALVYLSGLSMLLVIVDKSSAHALLIGVLSGIVALATYGLGHRAASGPQLDPFEGSLLVEPIGYANALGVLAAIGVVLAIGLLRLESAGATKLLFAGAAAVSGVALGLTSSRAAWISLGVGCSVLLAFEPRARSVAPRRWTAIGAALVVAAALWLGLGRSVPSLGDRPAYWHAALGDVKRHPLIGSGAGSFDDYWYSHRDIRANVQDAHSLYLETFAELGVVGLALLLGVLVPPLAGGLTARAQPISAVATASYATFLVHAGLDWDWEMPTTTLTGIATGTALLVVARPSAARSLPRSVQGAAVGVSVALCLVGAFAALRQP